MEIKALQLEILEAERLIERNRAILQLHRDLTAERAKLTEIEAEKEAACQQKL